jgi:SAM-dependent methyltransferase
VIGLQRATESRGLAEARADLDAGRRRATELLRRVLPRLELGDDELILDLGCAAAGTVLGLRRLGRRALGLEPDAHACRTAVSLAAELDETLPLVGGLAERIPLADGSCGLVLADNLLEHVDDPVAVFTEVARVLRPGGGFWFYSTSALSPRQGEIRGFPLFGWYPDGLKKRIMRWARDNRPALVGGTRRPAWHWYTPSRVGRLLRRAGFHVSYDRWRLRRPDNHGPLGRIVLRLINAFPALKLAADVVIPESSYLALK